jgi:hypothetical protein
MALCGGVLREFIELGEYVTAGLVDSGHDGFLLGARQLRQKRYHLPCGLAVQSGGGLRYGLAIEKSGRGRTSSRNSTCGSVTSSTPNPGSANKSEVRSGPTDRDAAALSSADTTEQSIS